MYIIGFLKSISLKSNDLEKLFTQKSLVGMSKFDCGKNCIISMSLYGSRKQFLDGAINNAKSVEETFPGWKLRIYVPFHTNSTKEHMLIPEVIITKLKKLNVDIQYIDLSYTQLNPRMWRFLIADDMTVDRFIVRDADSRLTNRDYAEVRAWIASGKIFHTIKDHPRHRGFPVLAGLWGAKAKELKALFHNKTLFDIMKTYSLINKRSDQLFLKYEIWPFVKDSCYCSDSFYCHKYSYCHSFQTVRSNNNEFLGEVFDNNGNPSLSDRNTIKMFLTKKKNQC